MKQIIIATFLAWMAAGCGEDGGGHGTPSDVTTEGDVVEDGIDDGPEVEDGMEDGPSPVDPPAFEVVNQPLALTPVARDAVALAPDWLQDDLALNMGRLQTMIQNEMAGLLLDLDDPDLTDEVAFVIAHTSPEVLEYSWFFSELIVQNARLIHEYDPVLDYVRIQNVGVPGVDPDYYTTLVYTVETASGTEERTIEPEMYYWYVVHPRLEDEMPWYVDGWVSGDPVRPDQGWFWREFLWDAAAVDCPAERTCPLLSEQMPGIEVFKRLSEDSGYSVDAQQQVYDFVEQVLDFGAGEERPTQPNRIYAVACGNCGEYADFTVSSLRTSLIPARNCGAKSNDHTWAEWWYQGDDWHGETWFYSGGIRRDRRDNDCDGIADDSLLAGDEDGDGVDLTDGDCDDTRAEAYPGADEVQNGRDDDCDGVADEGFTDSDLDADGDGWSIAEGDCNDADAETYPGAAETDDGVDDDCDGTADGGTDTTDADGDGFAVADGDCDDTRTDANPDATELMNGRDDDCDGVADEGFSDHDRDGDGWSIADGDCDDTRSNTHPDAQDPVFSSNRLYAITTTRGDSLLGLDRTEAYATLPSYLEFDIMDTEGRGVDGALVTVYGTWAVYGYPDQWAVATQLVTDIQGHASLTVGEANPYGYAVTSAIGDTPGEGHLFAEVDRSVPFETYTISRYVPGSMPAAADVTETDLTEGAEADLTLSVEMDVESYRIEADGMLYGSFSQEKDGGDLDVFLLDEANYALWTDGAFEAQWAARNVSTVEETVDLPRTGSWILVISNVGYTRSAMVGSVTLTASPAGDITWTADDPAFHQRFRIPAGRYLAITLLP